MPGRQSRSRVHPLLVGLQFGLVSFLVFAGHELVWVFLGGVHQLPVLGKPLGQFSNSKLWILGLDVGSVLKRIEHESRPECVCVCVRVCECSV